LNNILSHFFISVKQGRCRFYPNCKKTGSYEPVFYVMITLRTCEHAS